MPGAAEYQGAKFHFLVVGHIRRGGIQVAAIAGQLLGGHGQQLPGESLFRVGTAAESVKVNRGILGQGLAKVLPLAYKVTQLSRHQSGLQEAVQLQPHFFCPVFGGPLQIAVVAQNPEGILWGVIRRGGQFRINQSQIPVRCQGVYIVLKLFDVFFQGGNQGGVQILPPFLPGKQMLQLFFQALGTLGVHSGQGFPGGHDQHFFQVVGTPLGLGVKVAHGVQLIPEKFQSHRGILSGGVQVYNAAPHRELAHALYHAAAAVARGDQTGGEGFQEVFFSQFQSEAGFVQHCRGNGPLAQGFPAHNLNGGAAGN